MGVYSLGPPILELAEYSLDWESILGVYTTLYTYSLGPPVLELAEHPLEWESTLGDDTVGVYSLGPPILELVEHMLVLKKNYRGPLNVF